MSRWSRILSCAALSAILSASGCGGGGEGESPEVLPDPPVISALSISSTIPPAGDEDIATDLGAIVVTFSESLSSAGIDEDTIILRQDDGERIPAIVSYQGRAATIMPVAELSLLTRYTVTVASGLESVDGGVLEEGYAWDFTTRDGVWSEHELVDTHVSDSEDPIVIGGVSIGADPDGDALAVWTSRDRVMGAAYRRDAGWSNAQSLGPPLGLWSGVSRHEAKVHEMANGELWVSWREEDSPLCGGEPGGLGSGPCPEAHSTPEIILVSRYSRSTGWAAPELVGSIENREIRSHEIVSDASGKAVLVWLQREGAAGMDRVRAVHYSPDAGWGEVQELSRGFGSFFQMRVAMDPSGQVVVAWTRFGSNDEADLWAVRYGEAGWWEPQQISNGSGRAADAAALVMDGIGNALLAWEQDDSSTSGSRVLWAGVYDMLGQLRIQQMSSNVIWAEGPQLVSDANGHALLTFTGDGGAGVFGARYDADSGWGEAIQIGTAGVFSEGVALSMNDRGRGLAVWNQAERDVGQDVWAAAYDPVSGWAGAERVSFSAGDVSPLSLSLAMDEKGNALLVWSAIMAVTDDGLRGTGTWAARYRWEGSWRAPERLMGGTETFPYALVAGQSGRALVATHSESLLEDADATEVQIGVFRFE